jgi:hypothetical protein
MACIQGDGTVMSASHFLGDATHISTNEMLTHSKCHIPAHVITYCVRSFVMMLYATIQGDGTVLSASHLGRQHIFSLLERLHMAHDHLLCALFAFTHA